MSSIIEKYPELNEDRYGSYLDCDTKNSYIVRTNELLMVRIGINLVQITTEEEYKMQRENSCWLNVYLKADMRDYSWMDPIYPKGFNIWMFALAFYNYFDITDKFLRSSYVKWKQWETSCLFYYNMVLLPDDSICCLVKYTNSDLKQVYGLLWVKYDCSWEMLKRSNEEDKIEDEIEHLIDLLAKGLINIVNTEDIEEELGVDVYDLM